MPLSKSLHPAWKARSSVLSGNSHVYIYVKSPQDEPNSASHTSPDTFFFSQVKRKRKTISASPNRGYLRGHSTAGSSTELYLGLTPCCHGRVHSELSKTALPPDKTKANQVWGCTLFLGKTRPILLTVYMTAYLWKLEIRPWLWSECFHPSRRHTVKLNHQDAFRRRCLGGIRSWEGKPSWIEWWLPIPPIAWEAEGTTVHQTDEIV